MNKKSEQKNPLNSLKNKALIKNILKNEKVCEGEAFVQDKERGTVFAVENPAAGVQLAAVENQTAEDVESRLGELAAEQDMWGASHPEQRARLLYRWFELIQDNADDLALILTLEQGKPLAEARSEVLYGSSFVQWYAEEARRIRGQLLHGINRQHRASVIQQPVGVCASITPWNFPCAMVTRKIAPALAAGCTVILKPSELTPLSALALGELAYQAGIPRNVFAVVTGTDASGIGRAFCASEVVRHISFTGSTATGRILLRQCAPAVKKVALELGGNAPFIVFDDADIGAAIDGLLQCKLRNAGQVCVAANRVYVQSSVHDAFVSRLRDRMQQVQLGNGLDAGVQMGPLINRAAQEKVHALTAEAVRGGATRLLGGDPAVCTAGSSSPAVTDTAGGYFCSPVLLTDVTVDMQLVQQEIFGPVVAVQRFETEEEVIRMANSTEYGLAAYFYTQNLARTHRVSEALACGMVGVNTGMVSSAHTPFGGVRQSGLGREGGAWGLEEYLESKYVSLGGL